MDLLDPGIKLGSPELQANSFPAELPGEKAIKRSKSRKECGMGEID